MSTRGAAVTCWLLFMMAGGLLCHAEPTGRQVLPLNSRWEFRQRMQGPGVTESEWRAAQVPGCVHTDLLRHKLIPDPFYRDNESKLQWIENADWEYRTAIVATPELLKRRNILVSQIGVAAIQGLQGASERIDAHHVLATAKHFAAHGQPEGGTNTAPRQLLRAHPPRSLPDAVSSSGAAGPRGQRYGLVQRD